MNTRNFSEDEFISRFTNIQSLMLKNNIDAILLTSKADFHYFSGMTTQFWESPTRPMYLILPAIGKTPIAIIPDIILNTLLKTWIKEIYTWSAPFLKDDGLSLLINKLNKFSKNNRIGMPIGIETHLRMPFAHTLSIMKELNIDFVDVTQLIKTTRLIKSDSEIKKIRTSCQIASRSFDKLNFIINNNPDLFRNLTERKLIKEMQKILLDEGADYIPYIICNSGHNGYISIIDSPSDKILSDGDVIIIDIGIKYQEYFCDFDRNYVLNFSNPYIDNANLHLWNATEAGIQAAKPGNTFHDIWFAQVSYLTTVANINPEFYNSGRLGHSIGLELTELPSICKNEMTILEKGMTLSIEPNIPLNNDKTLVHEECIVITLTGCDMLSTRASKNLYCLKI